MRFTIRDVLWLMVVVGLVVALWIERTTVTPHDRGRSENSIAIGERGLLVKDCGWGFKLKAGAGSVVK